MGGTVLLGIEEGEGVGADRVIEEACQHVRYIGVEARPCRGVSPHHPPPGWTKSDRIGLLVKGLLGGELVTGGWSSIGSLVIEGMNLDAIHFHSVTTKTRAYGQFPTTERHHLIDYSLMVDIEKRYSLNNAENLKRCREIGYPAFISETRQKVGTEWRTWQVISKDRLFTER